jgi:hypothetical protein
MSANAELAGSVDPAASNVAHTASLTNQGRTVTFMVTIVGADHYIKVNGVTVPGAGNNWVHFDPAKVPSLGRMGLAAANDPTGLTVLQKAVVTAVRSAGKVTGTFDATRVGDALGGIYPADVPTMGDKAKAVPFEETLDANGHIVSIRIDVPAFGTSPAESVTTTYTAVGTGLSRKRCNSIFVEGLVAACGEAAFEG